MEITTDLAPKLIPTESLQQPAAHLEAPADSYSAIQDIFSNAERVNLVNTSVSSVSEPDKHMEMLKSAVGDYMEREHELGVELSVDKIVSQPTVDSLEAYHAQSRSMLQMQMALNEKSLNGAMLLSTAKSAEGFVKTLMRSQ